MKVGPTVKRIREEYAGKIRLVIKNVPDKAEGHAYTAALASLAAGDQGKYWEMHDLVLERSPKLDRESLIGYALEVGLDRERFERSLEKKEHAQSIERDWKLAEKLGVYATPTFFINGKKIVGDRTYSYLKSVIDEELVKAVK